MKIVLNTFIVDINGNNIVDKDGQTLSLKEIISTSLSMAKSSMSPTRAWDLAKEIHNCKDDSINIEIQEVAQIKEAIQGHVWTPMVIAQAFNSLENKE